uniref:Uncharacterized protein n=1 Tax=Oryza nivara TaxID=4536 RepID=A0A0E0GP13_ORYNI
MKKMLKGGTSIVLTVASFLRLPPAKITLGELAPSPWRRTSLVLWRRVWVWRKPLAPYLIGILAKAWGWRKVSRG